MLLHFFRPVYDIILCLRKGLQSGDSNAVAQAFAAAKSSSDAQGVASALSQAYSQGAPLDFLTNAAASLTLSYDMIDRHPYLRVM